MLWSGSCGMDAFGGPLNDEAFLAVERPVERGSLIAITVASLRKRRLCYGRLIASSDTV